MTSSTFATLEDAYGAAITQDKLVFAAASESKRGSSNKTPSSTPSSAFRAGSVPPPQVMVLLQLAAMEMPGFDWEKPSGPSTSPALKLIAGVSSVEKDHSVGPNDPIPVLTQEIRDWCFKNRTCFRCRQKNANHSSANCPRFVGIPDSARYTRLVNVVEEQESENEQTSG
eukprot:1723601-Rhodomonas_salina.2